MTATSEDRVYGVGRVVPNGSRILREIGHRTKCIRQVFSSISFASLGYKIRGLLLCSYKFSVTAWTLQTKRTGNKGKHWLVLFIAQEYIVDAGAKEGVPNQNTLNFHFCFQKQV